jgi:hypothetical protein
MLAGGNWGKGKSSSFKVDRKIHGDELDEIYTIHHATASEKRVDYSNGTSSCSQDQNEICFPTRLEGNQ